MRANGQSNACRCQPHSDEMMSEPIRKFRRIDIESTSFVFMSLQSPVEIKRSDKHEGYIEIQDRSGSVLAPNERMKVETTEEDW